MIKKMKRSLVTGQPFNKRSQNKPEDVAMHIKFIKDNPRLTNAQIAKRLGASCSYIWKLTTDNNLTYAGKKPTRRIIPKPVEEGFFDDSKSY